MSESISRKDFLVGASAGLLGLYGIKAAEAKARPRNYPEHRVTTTIFAIGEKPTKSNAYISNVPTEWESDATKRFGGYDDPCHRNASGLPANFIPKENPFYFALPAAEFDQNGLVPGAHAASPWASEASKLKPNESLFKGRWIKVENHKNDTVYGQWIDVGPGATTKAVEDYKYVFGNGSVGPDNQFGLHAGLDVSPTMAHYLHFDVAIGGIPITWQFVDAQDVPPGPWHRFPAINNQTHWS